MKRLWFAAALALLSPRLFAQTTSVETVVHDGLTRAYRLYVPSVYNGTSVPLLFNLHGYASNAWEQENYADFRPIADTANFIIVHPEATVDGFGEQSWNTFGFGTVDDVGFISTLIDTLSSQFNIDETRIYATGMSNGGFMAYELACQLGQRFAAVASVTGSMTTLQKTSCSPSHPMPILQIHGTADAIVPFFGGNGVLPIDSLVEYWINVNNCSTIPLVTQVPNVNTSDATTAEHYVYANGNNGSTVEFYKIIGGGHSWPGAPININITNMDFSASLVIWQFFNKYSLETLTSAPSHKVTNPRFSVFPNPSDGKVLLQFSGPGFKTIQVTNAIGQKIYETKTDEATLDLTLNQPGIYFIDVFGDRGRGTKKLFIR